MITIPPSLVAASIVASSGLSFGQADNFDDGDDAGWTRAAPLQTSGIPASYSFPNGNSYRLECGPNNVSPLLNVPRMGALRDDVSYTDFYVSVDIFTDDSIDQNVGLLARVQEVGLGMLDGYGVTYNRHDSAMFLTVITDEAGPNIAAIDVTAPPAGQGVRLIFQGAGSDLKVELFALNDLQVPLGTIEMADTTYASGPCGVFNVSDSEDVGTDSTFDNYLALPQPPADLEILDGWIDGSMFKIEFASTPGHLYILDEADSDGVFVEKDDSVLGALAATTILERPYAAGITRLYRLRQEP